MFRISLRNARLVPFLFLLFGTLFCAVESTAQVKRWVRPDSVPALQKVYNVEDDEFITGILFNKYCQEDRDERVQEEG